jgi:hypothetical protein
VGTTRLQLKLGTSAVVRRFEEGASVGAVMVWAELEWLRRRLPQGASGGGSDAAAEEDSGVEVLLGPPLERFKLVHGLGRAEVSSPPETTLLAAGFCPSSSLTLLPL